MLSVTCGMRGKVAEDHQRSALMFTCTFHKLILKSNMQFFIQIHVVDRIEMLPLSQCDCNVSTPVENIMRTPESPTTSGQWL